MVMEHKHPDRSGEEKPIDRIPHNVDTVADKYRDEGKQESSQLADLAIKKLPEDQIERDQHSKSETK